MVVQWEFQKEKKERDGQKNTWKNSENLQNLVTNINLYIYVIHWPVITRHSKRSITRCFVIQHPKRGHRILKAQKNDSSHSGAPQ